MHNGIAPAESAGLLDRTVERGQQRRRLRDRIPPLSALERHALHALLRNADVQETPHGPVIVSPVTLADLEVLEIVGSYTEDFEPETIDSAYTEDDEAPPGQTVKCWVGARRV